MADEAMATKARGYSLQATSNGGKREWIEREGECKKEVGTLSLEEKTQTLKIINEIITKNNKNYFTQLKVDILCRIKKISP
jgi:hypothetical protein